MKKILIMALALLALAVLPASAQRALHIVATNFPCYDFARQLSCGGDEVTMLLKPGTEAHSYDPTPADILAISQADLFVYVGGESDAWVDGILASFDGKGPRQLRMMDAVANLIEEDEAGGHHGKGEAPEYDEHIWTSPVNAKAMVHALGEALASISDERASEYLEGASALEAQIAEIDEAMRGIAKNARRSTLVFADRFPFVYLTREYGLDHLAAFPSCTADTEPSAQVVMALIDKVVSDNIPVIYTIELSAQAIARTVSEETGAKVLTLHSMQTVSQEEFDAGESYVSLMRRNVEAVREGLQ